MRGRKTGGRDFKKGEGGRPKGAKNKVPWSVKAEVKEVLRKMGIDQERAKEIFRRVCRSKGAQNGCPHLAIAAFFLALGAQVNSRHLGYERKRTEPGPNW